VSFFFQVGGISYESDGRLRNRWFGRLSAVACDFLCRTGIRWWKRILTIRRMEDPTSFRGHTRNSLQLRAN
jgi:hypothetical protein